MAPLPRGARMLNLLPKDEKYFERFTELAIRIDEAAKILSRFFEGQAAVAAVADQVKRLEHECDEISHEILRGIDRTFITPIDREDIHQLAVRLDDVIDLIDGTVRRLSLFKIAAPTPLSRSLSKVVVQTTGELVEAVSRLRTQKGVMERCIRIKQLENEADVVYHDAIASLFAEELPAIEVIKWKDVYDTMERTVDSCVVVAHVLESVVLKHS
jgi:predicted phosphate transport protein (TIGR00153 family)